MRKGIIAIAILFSLLTAGCSRRGEVVRVYDSNYSLDHNNAKTIPIETIVIDNFKQAILIDGVLVPGDGSEWGTNKDTFINNIYGTELVDPDSGYFQEHRNATNKKGLSTIEPPLKVLIKNIDKDYSAIPIYMFNADNSLCAVNYRYLIDLSDENKLLSITKSLISEIENADNDLTMETKEAFDIDSFNFKEDKVILKWGTSVENQFVCIAGISFADKFILDIIVSNETHY